MVELSYKISVVMKGIGIKVKLLHTSDLHIGKRVNEFSMIEDQKHILNEMLKIVDEHKPEGFIIAGDIYDKGIPGVEAVTLFDWFLTELHNRDIAVFIVSGNHDSSERIDFAGRIMEENNIHIAGAYNGELQKVTISDEFGHLNIYLMPFIKPATIRRFYPDLNIETYQEAVEAIIDNSDIDPSERNLLVAHQFITYAGKEPERSESEVISLGGLDNIDGRVFDCFDYVALGHIHRPQRIGRDTVRYAGSPLKYSFSESRHSKSVTMVEMGEKGTVQFDMLPLIPLRDMREIKGPIETLIDPTIYREANTLDYIHATITNEEEIYDGIGTLRSVYPNVMRLDFENSRSVFNENARMAAVDVEEKSSTELFEEFYESQNNVSMSDVQISIIVDIFEEMAGERE